MVIERMTAKKVRISELTNGKWVKKEGMEPSFVETSHGDRISRARIMATIVAKFVAEDENFASVTLDDSTDTIRAKTFKTAKPIDSFEVGDMVDLIGKVREYNDEIYIIPEVVTKVTDPNMELLRVLEIKKRLKELEETGAKEPAKNKEDKKTEDKEALRKEILNVIEKAKDGTSYKEIFEQIKKPEELVEGVINELLAEGICYEPLPGKVKKI
jgi:RPA family protein